MPAVIIEDASMVCQSECYCMSSACSCCEGGPSHQTSLHQEATFSTMDVDSDSIKLARESEGRCADCGMQTHEFQMDPLTKTRAKVPLTISREVHRGRCLFCYPVFPQEFLNQQGGQPVRDAKSMFTSKDALSVPNTKPGTFPARRVSQLDPNGYHNLSDPMVQQALAVLKSNTFDIVDILSAIKSVPHDRCVQERGCERLWVLSWEDENSAAIGRVGGISVILDAMARFPMNAHLQQCGCESLQNLAVNNYNRREICDLGGVVLIVQAMMRHEVVPGIQQCGCTALASIAGCKSYHKDITRAGGFHAIVMAARNFADEESVLRAAYDAVYALGYDPAGRLPSRPEVPVMIEPMEK